MPEKPRDRSEPGETLQPAAEIPAETVDAAPEGLRVPIATTAGGKAVDEPVAAAASVVPEPLASPVGVVAAPVEAREPAVATIRLEKKHPLAIRWMHWVNFPVLFTMIWSGLLIYWNDSDNAYQHPHAVYRVGVGSLTLVRLFPPWFWKLINAPYRVTEGLGYHFFFMWIFAINGILYVAYLLISGEWRVLVPERRSFLDAILVTLVDLHLRKGLPPQKKYNGAQKIAYSSVVLMGLGSLVTGLSIYKPTQVHWITSLLGGYEMARWEHFWLTMGFCAFFVVHVGQVILAGWNNFRSMVSGYEIVPAVKASLDEERRTG
ncbi:cytochrome b/b6 domain-containing protein [Tunturiibacter gelidoferens]|uniref:Thiosulfate reductase cytochrome b subunit n=1 Tax=Tunturiibacter lichenicola TaxID=2051959 RepID=A0A7Y9T163_9BACT|nr:cytochrome b/b6 domain-containing protein [Edaphobacter lichenicola]NYF50113.1 thiosulfate reductase cytochrome b subunit [Edaphobacter lichenicola]